VVTWIPPTWAYLATNHVIMHVDTLHGASELWTGAWNSELLTKSCFLESVWSHIALWWLVWATEFTWPIETYHFINTTLFVAILSCCFVDFYSFCIIGNRNEYSTGISHKVYNFTVTVRPHCVVKQSNVKQSTAFCRRSVEFVALIESCPVFVVSNFC